MKKQLNPYKWKWGVNVFFLVLILFFIGNIILGLITGIRKIECLVTSGVFFIIILYAWVTAIKPFIEDIEKLEKKRK